MNIPDRVLQVYVSSDYGKFKRLLGNRAVTNKRVGIIKRSIENYGYISNPIIVNEKYEVIDGQGRLEALRQLGRPIEYVIQPGLSITECMAMNLKPTSWSLADFVESFAEQGNENYQRLVMLQKKYGFSYSLLYSIGTHGSVKSVGSALQKLRLGDFKLTAEDAQVKDEICKYLSEFKDVQKIIGGRSDAFYCVIAWVGFLPGVDKERLRVSVHQQYRKIPPVAKIESTLTAISDVYNTGYRKSNRRYFDYEWKTTVHDEVKP